MSSTGISAAPATIAPVVVPAAAPAPVAAPAPKPDLISKVVAEVQQIEVAVENVVHTVIVKVEAGWTWVEGEFVVLENEAKAAYEWVQKEDPQLAAQVRQMFLNLEGKAQAAVNAEAGPLGTLVSNVGDQFEEHVANFVQGYLGSLAGGTVASEAKATLAYLASKGEGILQAVLSKGFAKVVGGLLASTAIVA